MLRLVPLHNESHVDESRATRSGQRAASSYRSPGPRDDGLRQNLEPHSDRFRLGRELPQDIKMTDIELHGLRGVRPRLLFVFRE